MDTSALHPATDAMDDSAGGPDRPLADERALREQFRLAIDTIPGLVWSAEPDGAVDFLNQRWYEYTGLTFEQARGAGWQAAVCPEDLPALLQTWARVLASGLPGEAEARLRRHDGADRWFLFRAVPLHDADGRVTKWYGETTDIEERRRARENLRRQTAHLDELFELAPHAVVLVDATTTVIRVNREFTRMFGYTPEEAVHRPLGELIAPEDRMGEYRNNARLLGSGEKVESETVRRRKDGVRLAVSMTASPVLTAGPIEGYIIYRDITERKRAEALVAGEKRLLEMIARGQPLHDTLDALCRLVEEQSPGAFCSVLFVDQDGTHLRDGIAPSLPASYFHRLEGWVIGPNEGPCAVAAWRRSPMIATNLETDPFPESYRQLARAHGLGACWSNPVLSRDGRVLATLAILWREPRTPTVQERSQLDQFRDLASIAIEHAHAGDALRRSRAFMVEGQRLSRTGTFFWRPESGELTWSDETYRIFEVERAVTPTLELVRSRVYPEDLAQFEAAAAGARTEGRALDLEHRLRLPGGGIKHIRVMAHATEPSGGAAREYVGAVMDITARKRSDDDLDRLRLELAHVARVTTLGQLTASIAHEINQPLAGIVLNGNACLRWLAGDPPNLDEGREAARRIVRDGQRAGEVIARLRSLFQRHAPAKEPLLMDEVLKEVLALARGELQKAGVSLRLELAESLSPVVGDRVQLQQLLLNLILNAAEAVSLVHDRPRTIVIRTAEGGHNDVQVSVQDSGVGLPAHGREQVFDAFYTSKPGGMGMGLAISRSIAENHGGRLWVAELPGPGTTFELALPRLR